ncbi:hypothetical protein [Actinoplanes sp. N902-109]|uniref:hypothetical protein n=1 Tax=Actinoplanes sp. (strain N902-109) TaxID=649831 RepID=UPI00032949DB|nr:hypothetical protein [Actinoplanes sp. N902-109]AGL13877.1 hypothetical protein L083_0367 [Actinoplanes sp. N902-109]
MSKDLIDPHEVKDFAETLGAAGGLTMKEARAIVAKGSLNIKRDARALVEGHKHIPGYPSSITYETHETLKGPYGLIGPEHDKRQGALGHIIEGGDVEYGDLRNAPIPHLRPAAEKEQPRFEKALEDAARRAVEGR